ncbi:hypothetical protein NX059_001440 [Plenodomus lindquistii]|nr:hypothetical protein NX059_001440 [Plenodomus lindquistii]
MATVKKFSDLPGELVQHIAQHLLRAVSVPEAWAIRGASRALRDAITYEVIHHVPTTEFTRASAHDRHGWDKARGRRILQRLIGLVHESPVRKTMEDDVYMVNKSLAEDVLGYQGHVDTSSMMATYTKKIMHWKAYASPADCADYILRVPGSHHSNIPYLSLVCSAVAATGSVATFHCYFRNFWDPSHLNAKGKLRELPNLWPEPLSAAASTGELDMVHFLLSLLKERWQTEGSSHPRILHEAIDAALRSKQVEVVNVLAKFRGELGFKASTYRACCSSTVPCAETWLSTAAATGCFKACYAALDAIPKHPHYPDKHEMFLFVQACKYGQTDLMRRIQKRLPANLLRMSVRGSSEAAAHGQVGAIKVLQELGTQFNDYQIMGNAIVHGNMPTMLLLLKIGLKIDRNLFVIACCHLRAMKYNNLRDFKGDMAKPLALWLTYKLTRVESPTSEYDIQAFHRLVEDVEDSKYLAASVERLTKLLTIGRASLEISGDGPRWEEGHEHNMS